MEANSVFCWLVAQPARSRIARRDLDGSKVKESALPVAGIYTQAVILELTGLSASLPMLSQIPGVASVPSADRPHEDQAAGWSSALEQLALHVVGFCWLSPLFIEEVSSILSDAGEQCRDFWALTKYHDEHFLHCQASSSNVLPHAVPSHARVQSKGATADSKWFYELSEATHEHLQVLAQDLLQGQATTRLCLKIPAPHALLLAAGRWAEYCLPVVLKGRTRSFAAGAALLKALPLPAVSQEAVPVDGNSAPSMFDPVHLRQLTRSLRKLLSRHRQISEEDLAAARQDIATLLGVRAKLYVEEALMTRRFYSLQTLVEAVLVSSNLRSQGSLKPVLQLGLQLVVRSEQVCRYFLSLLERRYALPKKSFLNKHRLTVLMAFMQAQAQELDKLLDGCRQDCIVRWSTMDASPQKGYEWVMQGHRFMAVKDLPEALQKSDMLIQGSFDSQTTDACRNFLIPRLMMRPCLPAAVGSGRASVAHKICAAAHSERAGCNSWTQVAHVMNSTFTRTGDLGAESHVVGWKGSLTDLLGDWLLQEDVLESEPRGEKEFSFEPVLPADSCQQEQPGFLFADVTDAVPEPRDEQLQQPSPAASSNPQNRLTLDFRDQIYCAGLLHIAHNMCKDMHNALEHWPVFVDQLTHVCRLLSQKFSRDRLLQTCFSELPWSAFQDQFKSFNSNVYGGRWNTVMIALTDLFPLLHVLRRAWSSAKFGMKQEDFAEEAEDTGAGSSRVLSLKRVDEALTSHMFAAYAHAMLKLADCMLHLSHWAESCPCQQHHSQAEADSCPLKSCRAPELACGALPVLLQRSLDRAHAELLSFPELSVLSEADLQVVIADWTAARKHVQLLCEIKLAHWQQHPYVLFGIAHHDPQERIKAAKRSLSLYDSAAAEADGDHALVLPGLCHECCSKDISSCRAELQMLAQGETEWEKLPKLCLVAGKCKFVPVAERWVEGLRASTKRSVRAAPHAGPAHVAFEFMLPFLRRWLEEVPQRLGMLADHAHATSHLLRLCRACGVLNHPQIQELCQLNQHGQLLLPHKLRPKVVEVLLHCDAASHFRKLPATLMLQDQKAMHPELPAAVAHAVLTDAWERMWSKYALQHIKTSVAELQGNDEVGSRSRVVYSMSGCYSPLPLSSFTNPKPELPSIEDGSEAQFLCHGLQTRPADALPHHAAGNVQKAQWQESRVRDCLFFRVAHLNPGRAVVVSGVPRMHGEGNLLVEELPVMSYSTCRETASVSVEGEDGVASVYVLAAITSSPKDLLGIRQWAVSDRIQYELDAVLLERLSVSEKDALQLLLQDMVSQQAFDFTGTGKTCRIEQTADGFASEHNPALRAARLMSAYGLFTCISRQEECSQWQLTKAGLHCLSLCFALHSPQPLFAVPEEETLTIESACETPSVLILLLLQKQGFEFRYHEKGKKPRVPPVFQATSSSTKICWLHYTQATVCHEYLVALCTAALHEKEVPHFQSRNFYVQLLFGKDSARQQPRRGRRPREKQGSFQFQTLYDSTKADAVALASRKRPGQQRGRGAGRQAKSARGRAVPAGEGANIGPVSADDELHEVSHAENDDDQAERSCSVSDLDSCEGEDLEVLLTDDAVDPMQSKRKVSAMQEAAPHRNLLLHPCHLPPAVPLGSLEVMPVQQQPQA